MNKFLKALVVAALAVSASHVQAHTNKTFLQTRSHGVNSALENGGGFRDLVMREDKNRFGGNFQAAFFYNDSTKGDETGKYFLFKDKNEVKLPLAAAAVAGAGLGSTEDLDVSFFVRHAAGNNGAGAANIGADANAGKLKFDPSHTAYGVYFNYFQDLDKIFKGLYFSVNLPVVHVENDLNLQADGTDKDALIRYFKGNAATAEGPGVHNAQLALTHAKIDGKDSATGIADIDIVVGYKFLDKDTYQAAVNVGLTIPTGNEAEGKKAFEAVYGNGQHFAFGAGLDFCARVWGDHNHNLKVGAGFNFRYLFEASEKRTLGLKNAAGQTGHFAHYYLLGENGQRRMVPAANVLTQNVDVTPGSQFDGNLSLSYGNGGFCS